MLTEVFLSFVVSSGIACLLALAQYIFKSKCDTVECCCIKIHRQVQFETNEDISQIELPPPLKPKLKKSVSLDSILRK
jgi:hypothetical protein